MEPRDRKNPLLDQIRRMATLQQVRQMPDRELLVQFVGQHDEAAFRILMDRYGPMVLRVCKRILGNDHDAEDAYQATSVVLTSEAGAKRWQESVAAWLHSVAVPVAGNARRASPDGGAIVRGEGVAADERGDAALAGACGALRAARLRRGASLSGALFGRGERLGSSGGFEGRP